jgi:hypothetical protein
MSGVEALDGHVAVRRFLDFVTGFRQPADQPAAQRIVIVSYQYATHNVPFAPI